MNKTNQRYDLEERTAKFGKEIIEFCKSIKINTINKPLISQFIRSATSIGANSSPSPASQANTFTAIDSSVVTYTGDTSIAIGTDNLPAIAYYEDTNDDLKVCKCANTSCTSATCTTIDSTGSVGARSSIAIGTDNLPVIAYWDATNADLKVCKCSNSSCTSATCSTIDSTGSVGLNPSIAIGTDGLPVIAEANYGTGDLKVCKCANTSCTSATCTTPYASHLLTGDITIAIGTDGLPVIALNDNQCYIIACKCADTSCTSATCTALAGTAACYYSSLAIGPDALPVITYMDWNNDYTSVCKCTNSYCTAATCTTIDTAGGYPKIAVGNDGLPVISHYYYGGGTTQDLRVCKCRNDSCTTATCTSIDTGAANVGYVNSIAVGTDGLPVIAYGDNTNNTLKVAKCGSPSCSYTPGYYWSGGSDLGSRAKFFNNVFATQYWGKQFQIANFADVAENYFVEDGSIEAGDVVRIKNDQILEKTDKAYDEKVLGVISENPAIVLSAEEGNRPLALAGRVPVKISANSPPIIEGDPLTSSDESGKAMKADKAGFIIGKALESWTPNSGKDKIMVFISPGWYDPEVYLTDIGDLHISSETQNVIGETPEEDTSFVSRLTYHLLDAVGNQIKRVGAFADLIVANIKAGRIETQELVSPLAEIEEIKTQRLSLAEIGPATESGNIIINLENKENQENEEDEENKESRFGKLIIKGENGQAVASIDAQGNATFAGTLTANEATITGTLFADEIITKHGKFGDLLVNEIAKITINTPGVNESYTPGVVPTELATPSAILSEEEIDALVNEILASSPEATSQAELSENINIPNDLLVSNSLNIGGTLTLSDNSLNTLTGPLYLQNLGLGGIDILAGKIVIDEHGNATFEGDVTVKGNLAAKTIRPLPENDLVIDLAQIPLTATESGGENTDSGFGQLLVKGLNGQTVASIDASGSATFSKLNIAAANASQSEEIITPTEIKTNATAGKATLPINELEITIKSPFITENTLIYVTPISDTQNKVIFVKSKKAREQGELGEIGWFKVAIDTPIEQEIKFNWWIIN